MNSTTRTGDRPFEGVDEPIVSVKPIVLAAPGRGVDVRLKVSAPLTGDRLPIILFSHGYGSSLEAYGPLTDYWASNGFVVIQPTYLDSRTVGLPHDDPRTSGIWKQRVTDARNILDHLDVIEAAVPGLAGRVDANRIAAAGHSFGGQTTGILLGLRVLDADTGELFESPDQRVVAGALIATAGLGGEYLTPFAIEHFSYLNPDFDRMAPPALVVMGDEDDSPLTTRGPDWSADPYTYSPGEKTLLTVFGGQHSLGGIPGYEAAETTDPSPERLALVQNVSLAFFRHALGIDDGDWGQRVGDLASHMGSRGRIQTKSTSLPQLTTAAERK